MGQIRKFACRREGLWRSAALILPLMAGLTAGFAAEPLEVVSRVHSSQISDTPVDAVSGFFPEPRPLSLSADGRYAVFLSAASNLAPGQGDVNGIRDEPAEDVFLADLVTGAATLVSHSLASTTTTGNRGSQAAVISADGRWVAFISAATDLAAGQVGNRIIIDYDVLLWDRVSGATTLVAATKQELASFSGLAISADGRYLAFASDAFDLIPGQQGVGRGDVFLYDRVDRTTRLVSHVPGSPVTGSSDGGSGQPRISADGRFIVFLSTSGDLVPGQIQNQYNVVLYDRTTEVLSLVGQGDGADISSNGKVVVFSRHYDLALYDRETRGTTAVSSTALGTNGGNTSRSFALSADGRFVAFLVLENGFASKAAVYDRLSRTTTLVSRPAGASLPTGQDGNPTISADGRYVTFASTDPAWVPGQIDPAELNQDWDIFLYDRSAGRATLVSRSTVSATTAANRDSYAPVISANGSRIVFYSEATDLVAGLKDLNLGLDLFAWDVSAQSNRPITLRASNRPSLSPAAGSLGRSMSADGRYIAFESAALNLVAGQVDTNREEDVFLYDAVTKTTVLVSRTRASAAATASMGSSHPVISSDGRYVAFFSRARNLVPGANPSGSPGLFLFDRVTSTVTFVARLGLSYDPESRDNQVRLSSDGRWLAFTSLADDLVPGQQEDPNDFAGSSDVFLWDRTTGGILLVSRSTAGPTVAGNHLSSAPALSADGRYVTFYSGATDLIAGQIIGNELGTGNVFLFDRITGGTILVSHARGSAVTSVGAVTLPLISANGRFVVFTSEARDLDPDATPIGNISVYVYDRTLGTYQLAGFYNFFQQGIAISDDGRVVVFSRDDGQGTTHLYLYDRVAKSRTLITHDATLPSATGNGESGSPAVSADGRYVAFTSEATNLIAGEITAPEWDGSDVFLFDRVAGTTTLLSRWKGSPVAAAGDSFLPLISASGRQVAFTSGVDLIPVDANRRRDAYLFNFDPAAPGGPVTIPPCLLFDTRRTADGPALRSNAARVVRAAGVCGVPATAKRVAAKVTVFQGTGKGNVRLYPGDLAAPSSGILRFSAGQTRSATFDLAVAPNGAGTLTILPFVAGKGRVGVSVEISGYTP